MRTHTISRVRERAANSTDTMKKCAVTSNKVPLSKPKPWTRSSSVLTWKSSKDDTAARLSQSLDQSRWTGQSIQWAYSQCYHDFRARCAAFRIRSRTQVSSLNILWSALRDSIPNQYPIYFGEICSGESPSKFLTDNQLYLRLCKFWFSSEQIEINSMCRMLRLEN